MTAGNGNKGFSVPANNSFISALPTWYNMPKVGPKKGSLDSGIQIDETSVHVMPEAFSSSCGTEVGLLVAIDENRVRAIFRR